MKSVKEKNRTDTSSQINSHRSKNISKKKSEYSTDQRVNSGTSLNPKTEVLTERDQDEFKKIIQVNKNKIPL